MDIVAASLRLMSRLSSQHYSCFVDGYRNGFTAAYVDLLPMSTTAYLDDFARSGRAGEMFAELIDALHPRATQMFPAEVFAVLACVSEHLHAFRSRDVIFPSTMKKGAAR